MRVKTTTCEACESYAASEIDLVLNLFLCRSCFASFNTKIEDDTDEYLEFENISYKLRRV
jgi:hypothetical protein